MTVVTAADGRSVAVCGQPVADPADWTGAELLARTDWRFAATAAESAHLADMARAAAGRLNGDPNRLLKASASDFDLGPFAGTLAALLDQLRDGTGIALYRGLPLDDLSPLEAMTAYWAMGLHMGAAQSNNPEGDMIAGPSTARRTRTNGRTTRARRSTSWTAGCAPPSGRST